MYFCILSWSYIIIVNWESLKNDSITCFRTQYKGKMFSLVVVISKIIFMLCKLESEIQCKLYGVIHVLCEIICEYLLDQRSYWCIWGTLSLQGIVFGKRSYCWILANIHLYYSVRIVLKMFGQWVLLCSFKLLTRFESPNMDSKSPNRDSYVLNVFHWLLTGSILSQGTFIVVHDLVGTIPTRVFPSIKSFPS